MNSFKLVFVGDCGVGKTTFLTRHLTGEFTEQYNATCGVDIKPYDLLTNHGNVRFNVWDGSGQTNMGDKYYKDADCAIVFFDVTNERSWCNVPKWLDALRDVCPDIPIVLCGNKVDTNKHAVSVRRICRFYHEIGKKNFDSYYYISARSNYNFEKPFLFLAQKLISGDLEFISASISTTSS